MSEVKEVPKDVEVPKTAEKTAEATKALLKEIRERQSTDSNNDE